MWVVGAHGSAPLSFCLSPYGFLILFQIFHHSIIPPPAQPVPSLSAPFLFGFGLGLSSVLQPGPLQAFLLARIAAIGWRRTMPAVLTPLITAAPIALLALFVLNQMSPAIQHMIQAGGGLLLAYFGWSAYRQWRRPPEVAASVSVPRTMLEAIGVNMVNPHPYIGWGFVLGPAVLSAWRDAPMSAVVLLAAFYGTMTAGLVAFVYLAGTARFLSARSQRVLMVVSAALLVALGLYLLLSSLLQLSQS
jgi:threonine/homoserine/homoserine lactone efflux protein